MYLLDTNAVSRILNGRGPQVLARARATPAHMIAISAVVRSELLYGARHSGQVERNLENLSKFFRPFASIPYDDRCAEQYGIIRSDLARTGQLIGPMDMLIAATAKAYDLTLVTHNVREFSRVAGLRYEDWEN